MTEKRKKAKIVWDIDDTKGWLSRVYDMSYLEYFLALYTFFPTKIPSLHPIYRKFFEIEKANSPEWGVKRGRVAQSMIDQYREICDWLGQLRQPEHEEQIKVIGDKPFQLEEWQWIEGAQETLAELKKRGHQLYALTCYEESLFGDKVRMHGFERYFDVQNMLPIHFAKTREDFIQISGWTPELDEQFEWYAVGNGESDIKPALEVSPTWRGLYIPHKTTSPFFENSDSNYDAKPMDDPRVVTLKNIKEVLSHI